MRRFKRVPFYDKIFFEVGEQAFKAKLLDLSLNGALIELENDIAFKIGDIWQITFQLPNSEVFLQFRGKAIHNQDSLVGLKIVHINADTMIHLRSLMEARTSNMNQVAIEIELLYELNQPM